MYHLFLEYQLQSHPSRVAHHPDQIVPWPGLFPSDLELPRLIKTRILLTTTSTTYHPCTSIHGIHGVASYLRRGPCPCQIWCQNLAIDDRLQACRILSRSCCTQSIIVGSRSVIAGSRSVVSATVLILRLAIAVSSIVHCKGVRLETWKLPLVP